MITARQTRAARALLGWTQETLAEKALVSLTALKRLESESGLKVYESDARSGAPGARGQWHRLPVNSDQGEGVMFVRAKIDSRK